MVPTTRRGFLRTTAGIALLTGAPGVASATTEPRRDPGIVWTRRDANPGTQQLFDVVRGPDHPFAFCGYGTSYGDDRTVVRLTDRWGRLRSQRRGSDDNEWGDRGHELLVHEDGLLLAGVDDDAPLLLGINDPLAPPDWARTYDGTPEEAVHAATTGDGYAVGWTEAGESADAVMVGTDRTGTQQWSDRPGENRRLTGLVSAGTDSASLVAVGRHTDGTRGGWATAWSSDGSRERDLALDAPGDGPAVAVADCAAVVLAGATGDGWWLQRRASDWSVDWTRTYAAEGSDRGVDDLVARSDGFGLLAHDEEGTVLLRADERGEEHWRGRYAPYTDGNRPADRGHAMVPVDGDEFVLAGVTAPGEDGRDWWAARVGEPGATTPADTPEPTPTPTPTDATFTSPPGSTDDTGTRNSESPGDGGGEAPTSSTATGFGVGAAVAGLAGWLGIQRRDE